MNVDVTLDAVRKASPESDDVVAIRRENPAGDVDSSGIQRDCGAATYTTVAGA